MRKQLICTSISILTLLFNVLYAQEEVDTPERSAAEQIQELHNGVLLVRLPTKQNSIDALMKSDRKQQAEQVRLQTRNKNLELMAAMRDEFTFCPFYFFYSYDSEHILNGQLDSVTFLGEDLNPLSNVAIGDKLFYTAEVTLVSQDTSQKGKNLRDSEESDRDNQNETKFYGGANMRFQALIIKDSQFNQLRRPFPYYSRTLNSFFMKKTLEEVVETMDQKLWKFYGK